MYSNDGKIDTILIYSECNENASAVGVAFSIPSGSLSLVKYPVFRV
jgi:hypothetical protein